MKLTIHQNKELKEEEIVIHCIRMDKRLQKLCNYIRQFTFSVGGENEGKQYQLAPEEIYYIDSVDSKSFLYDAAQSYFCRQTLTALESQLKNGEYLLISRNYIEALKDKIRS